MKLVDAQQSERRARPHGGGIVSVRCSGQKIKRGLSAGRVQSVALRIIGDREDEINVFIPQEYWSMDAQFQVAGAKNH